MTNMQSWVNHDGTLTSSIEKGSAVDLSYKINAVSLLLETLTAKKRSKRVSVKFLSLANCGLSEIPSIFSWNDTQGRVLAETVEYVSFYGNSFEIQSATGQRYDVSMNATQARELMVDLISQRLQRNWSNGFNDVSFPNLRELDLRACGITVLASRSFAKMNKLRSLYLGENSISVIDANAFTGLKNLLHLDLSRNFAYDENNVLKPLVLETMDVFKDMENLLSLDFSHTLLSQRNSLALRSLSPKVQRLSLCYSGLTRLREDFFINTSLKYLDVSGNLDILSHPLTLRGLEDTLEVLYGEDIALKVMEPFQHLRKLEILKVPINEITAIPRHITETLENLQVLDLDKNRLITWFDRNTSLMTKLKLLSVRDNSINMITEEMGRDLSRIAYVGLSRNFIVCNCHVRDIYELGWRNERLDDQVIAPIRNDSIQKGLNFHTGFQQYNELIKNRSDLRRVCDNKYVCDVNLELVFKGNMRFFDYNPADYQCLLANEGRSTGFERIAACSQMPRDSAMENMVPETWNKMFLIIIPAILLPASVCLFVMRRSIAYFLITMRNSATLSLISKSETPDVDTIYNYDVFVSYCNEDRTWVLDQLLPHVERDCNISVCLHERDFQVGLSILENIVSCMDRSRFIMLILSQRFLLSQWCQFEMHLAQHRLLETRREDLILILLEEIPRRLRPNTLHYLMLTKTYIVWPKAEAERTQFWKRLKKSLVTHKQKNENVSLA
ncbi:toll-like receptor 6 [Epargyreus clarus]|uniref:toll-like receptor 6 n=1 Tax=Epargyreus clarus TaxID=520877 RepID=UPI003C2BC7F1